MRLHEDEKMFEQAIRFTAQEKGLCEVYLEKNKARCFYKNCFLTRLWHKIHC